MHQQTIYDLMDHLLWSLIVGGIPPWRLAGIVREYAELLERLERDPWEVEEIRRKRRWRRTEI